MELLFEAIVHSFDCQPRMVVEEVDLAHHFIYAILNCVRRLIMLGPF